MQLRWRRNKITNISTARFMGLRFRIVCYVDGLSLAYNAVLFVNTIPIFETPYISEWCAKNACQRVVDAIEKVKK